MINFKSQQKYIRSAFIAALWFMLLSFPIMTIKVNTITQTVTWRWHRLIYVGIISFVGTWVWNYFLDRKEGGGSPKKKSKIGLSAKFMNSRYRNHMLVAFVIFVILYPWFVSLYQVGIMISALIFVMLGLGLNIVIGYGGLLHLGYAAFYAFGAYNYGLLYLHWNWPFWLALPFGAVSGMLSGLIIGVPVLRLRGDYLAIVTLAFGEIVRLLLENLSDFTMGPQGISQIPGPGFFIKLSLKGGAIYLYFIGLAMVVMTIFVIRRIEDSRIGRALEAMRDDEIAAQSMGIDITRTKLTTFVLGALWAGFAGVILAAKTTYINPGSFTLMESVMILVAVVLGGTGSIPGVILGGLLITLVPEYFRALSDYRMLMFGVVLVVMSIFRPQGIIPRVRKHYIIKEPL